MRALTTADHRMDPVTPADLAELLKTTAAAVLAAHGLDTDALPRPSPSSARATRARRLRDQPGLQVAKKVGANPRELAGWLAEALTAADGIASAEVAGPGFVNLRIEAAAQGLIVRNVLDAGAAYGHSALLDGQKINLEFVSANPTGPIHIGGTLGCRRRCAGTAAVHPGRRRGAGVLLQRPRRPDRPVHQLADRRRQGRTGPEDGYAGAYINDIADQILAKAPDALSRTGEEQRETFRSIGVDLMFDHIKSSLHEFGTDFDVYTHEDSMHTSGRVDQAIAKLRENGAIYEKDGATWLRTTEFGDDKDRVVIKSDGQPAYIAGDLAYYLDKRQRGFDLCIYMLGADHHGYIARLKAAAAALGDNPDTVEVLIGQMVNLVRDGQPVRMSKRAGTVITLDDLVDAIGVDAARYALIRSSVDTPIDIDLELWSSASSENPVYYVQYAHARLCALARNAAELGLAPDTAHLGLLTHDKEGALIRNLGEFSGCSRRPRPCVNRTGSAATWRIWRATTTASTTPAGSCRWATRSRRICTGPGWRCVRRRVR